MPFNGASDFPPRRDPPNRATQSKRNLTVVMLIFMACLLLAPILIATLVDVVKFIRAH